MDGSGSAAAAASAAADAGGGTAEEEEAAPAPRHQKLIEIGATVEVQQVDPNDPLNAAQSWEDLNLPDPIMKGIYAKGFAHPSRIQGSALPLLIQRRQNCIAQAQNGSGKTATFALAMLSLVNPTQRVPQALCLGPTRELAKQNAAVVEELGKFTGVRVNLIVPQANLSVLDGQIIVGTPGKVQEQLRKRRLRHDNIRIFVLDEADVMIDKNNNMGPQVHDIRRFLKNPNFPLQTLLFSATFDDDVKNFAMQLVPNANIITVRKEDLTLKNVNQFYMDCTDDNDKKLMLLELYSVLNIGQSIIFVNSKQKAFELASHMKEYGHAVSLITGTQKQSGDFQMDVQERDRVMEEFRSAKTKVLVSTDVLARGIDVPQVTMVVNFDIPLDRRQSAGWSGQYQGGEGLVEFATYLHRIGRTGRFGLKGIAINLITPETMPLMEQIRTYYACEVHKLERDIELIEQKVRSLRDDLRKT